MAPFSTLTVQKRTSNLLARVPTAGYVLLAMVGSYVLIFGVLTWRQQSNYGTFGYDMGIYDQSIWLLSRFKNPMSTVRGLNYFGHHINLITVLFVPFYWLGAGPHFLYLVQTIVMALGALPLWALTRDLTKRPWVALVPAGAYLLYPALEWINWWHFHPDALIITPLLFAWWLAHRRRWNWFAVAIACALLAKEDAGLAVAVMGVLLAFRGWRPVGVATAGAGVGWFLLCTRVLIPLANRGRPPFYEEFFPGFGDSMFEIVWTMVRHPSRVYEVAVMADRLTYYRQLFLPAGLLSLGSAPLMLITGPQLLVNVVSLHPPTHDIHYHYSAVPTVAVFLSTVQTFSWLVNRHRALRVGAVGLLVVSSVAGNYQWSPSPIGRAYADAWIQQPLRRHEAIKEALSLVKPTDGVAATYYLVPQLTHRVHIYEWPNPFLVTNWGLDGENPPNANDADVIVLDTSVNGTSDYVYEELVAPDGPYEIVFNENRIVVARLKPGF